MTSARSTLNSHADLQAFTEETTAPGTVARMTELSPGWANRRTLWHSAEAAIASKTCP